VAAWIPFYALWVLFILTYEESATLSDALWSGFITIGSAATLGLGVWWLTGRLPWPEGTTPRFYLIHLAVGLFYAVGWVAPGYALGWFETGINPLQLMRQSTVIGWQVLTGLWLYGFVAGFSYTLRTRRRLREQERIAARAEALALRAQVTALRAQLNPHFLFNALHSLTTLIQDDPVAAQRAVDKLGELLRYALDESDDEEVLLREEWAFTQSYLELERLRYEDRLRVDAWVDKAALAISIPPFSLQPLVENAVRHAIAVRPEGGRIEIDARVSNGNLEITVQDDGPGADVEDVAPASGLGLRSLRERLAALYGDRAGIALHGDGGFRAHMVIPVHRVPNSGDA
jgi:signal transduction histidine kinase